MKSLRRFSSDLESHLQETKREFWVRFAGDPESEVFMDLFVLRVENFFHLSHEFETQVTVVQNYPPSCLEALLNK